MFRFLKRAGGYVCGEDLFCLEYDFRDGVVRAAARLEALVDRVRGISDAQVDLIGISSGGVISRYYMAYGGSEPSAAEPASNAAKVRRVIYVGAPHRGSVSTIDRLHFGVVAAPFARRFSGHRRWQTTYDFLPHPDDPLFIDDQGNALDIDLYDAANWARLRIGDPTVPDLALKLERGRQLHRALDRAGAHPDTLVIAAKHLPTATRILVTGGAVKVPPCEPERGDPLRDVVYVPGDGAISVATACALPGLDEHRAWFAEPPEHHLIPSTPEIHRLVLEALLATHRPIPLETAREARLVSLSS
jgi:hypothetical protein